MSESDFAPHDQPLHDAATMVADKAAALDNAATEAAGDIGARLAALQAKVEKLLSEQIAPVFTGAANAVGQAAAQTRDYAADGSEYLTDTIKRNPWTTVAVALTAGFLLGRQTR